MILSVSQFINIILMNTLTRTESKFKEAILESKRSKDDPKGTPATPYE
jgi:hypothetical protein